MRFFRRFSLLLFFFVCSGASFAQSYTIKGMVGDTLNANSLHNASVTLIRAKDSILETFTRTAPDGTFQLQTTSPGKYIVLITYPSFADYVDIVVLDKKTVVDIGRIPMISRTHLLSEFVLKQQIGAIKIKGDTTEYMADSFAVRENATVEELLKKLPGIQVNKNGEVVAQGEKVQKILVDGEEFFTDDPAVVTKSLQSKAVEKVQVYDKKSDQAEFTGIDDGSREKTINLQLKEDHKKGYFGKVDAGGGTDGYFQNLGMINFFRGKQKISVFGIVSNTGKIGLGWEDRDKFTGGGGSETEVSENGDLMRYYSGGDDFESWNGTYNGQGLPKVWTGGAHYSNSWLQDKFRLNSNYRYSKQDIETAGGTITEQTVNDSTRYITLASKSSFSTGQRNRGDLMYEWKIDTTSNLKLTANGGYSRTISSSSDTTAALGNESVLLNTNRNIYSSDATSKTFNANLNWRKKFAKKGRNAAVTMNENYTVTDATGRLFSSTQIAALDTPIIIDQDKERTSMNFQLTGKLSYTEPLSKVAFLEGNYGMTVNNSSSRRISKDRSKDGSAADINYDYSSDYDFNVMTNTGGANLRFVFKKFNFSVGGAVSNTHFSQRDNLSDTLSFDRSYNNFFPKANFNYRAPGKQTNFSFSYSGYTKQPTIEQVQPFKQNTDPLNIQIGNPDLRQEFDHNFNLRYHDYKVLSSTYTYLGIGSVLVTDDIGREDSIINGVDTFRYINVDGNYAAWFYGGYGFSIKKLDLRMGINLNANLSHNNSYINGQRNSSNNNTYSIDLDFNHDKEKKYNLSYSPKVIFNQNTSSVNANNTNYWAFEQELNGNVELPFKFEIGTEIEWYVRQQVASFDRNNNVFRWNAWVSKKFLKSDALEVRASVFDILDQNSGYNRYGTGNTVTEENYSTIRRYGMLSLIWNFTKSPAGTPAAESGGMIIRR
jgi:hypothetical protein